MESWDRRDKGPWWRCCIVIKGPTPSCFWTNMSAYFWVLVYNQTKKYLCVGRKECVVLKQTMGKKRRLKTKDWRERERERGRKQWRRLKEEWEVMWCPQASLSMRNSFKIERDKLCLMTTLTFSWHTHTFI